VPSNKAPAATEANVLRLKRDEDTTADPFRVNDYRLRTNCIQSV
jgi:hypothetical protein